MDQITRQKNLELIRKIRDQKDEQTEYTDPDICITLILKTLFY